MQGPRQHVGLQHREQTHEGAEDEAVLDREAEQVGFLAFQTHRGVTPIWCAVLAGSEPNRALADVSEPVRKTPIQPRKGEKNGKAAPVPASTRASVDDRPE